MGTWLFETIVGRVVEAVSLPVGGYIVREFVPRIIRVVAYQGESIAGSWSSSFSFREFTGEEEITLKQEGHRIRGTIRTSLGKPGQPRTTMCSTVSGEFRGDYLLAYYTPSANTRIGSGALTLRLVDGGRRLEGRCIFQLSSDRSLQGIDYAWVRSKAD